MSSRLLKTAVLAVGATAACGGIALAAGTGPVLPGITMPTPAASGLAQASAASGRTVGIPADVPSSAADTATDAADSPESTDTPDPSDTPDATDTTDGSSSGPSPSMTGLCHAWLAGAGSRHGRARTNPAFTVLVTTAGGVDSVPAYCTTLLGLPAPTDSPTDSSTDSTTAADPAPAAVPSHPAGPPASHRSGRPDSVPSHSHP